ncbi:hypothetical protein ANCCEY_15517, partial [Ancylostoma ceylanicum]
MATRAVHPENLGNNSTNEFLLAFCRFAARRGVPDTVISDNSTLVAANDFLQMTLLEISGSDLANDYLSKQIVSSESLGILFTCMATRAVHPENLGNNSTKEFLLAFCRFAARRGVPDTVISDNSTLVAANDFLQMTLLEISGNDLVTLLLNIPGALTDLDYPPQGSAQESLLARHQETLLVLEKFWTVWHRDYLSALAERHQRRISQGRSTPLAPRVGHIVIMADDNLPRGRWPLAIIVELHSDRNNTVRTATVRTAK